MVKTIQHLYCSILLTFSSLQIVCYSNHNPHNIHITILHRTMVKGYDRIEISKLFMWNWLFLNFSILHSWELSFLKVRPSRPVRHVNRFYFLPVPLRSREWRVASFMNRQFCLILENISFWNKNIWIFIENFFLQAK